MEELDLYKAINNAVKMKKQANARRLSSLTMATAAGQGNKEANRKIKKILKEVLDEERTEQTRELLKTGQGKLVNQKLLTNEELKQLLGVKEKWPTTNN